MPSFCQSREKTRSGPRCRTATGSVWPAAWASTTASFWLKRILAKAQAGAQETVELAGGLEDVEAPEGGEHGLLYPALVPEALDDLEIGVGAGTFDAEEHGGRGLARRYPLRARENRGKCGRWAQNLALQMELARKKLMELAANQGASSSQAGETVEDGSGGGCCSRLMLCK